MSWIAAAVVGGAAIGLIGSSMTANAAESGAEKQYQATTQGQQQQLAMFNKLNEQNLPYRSAGYGALNTLQSMMPGQYQKYDLTGQPVGEPLTGTGELTRMFTNKDLNANLAPNYEFMRNQGLGAVRQNINVGGGGSNANMAATKFAEDYAKGAYQDALNNWRLQQGDIYNRLSGIAGIGQASQQQSNALGTNAATQISQLGVSGANALAAGGMGAANAWGSGISNVGQSVGNAAIMYKLMNA